MKKIAALALSLSMAGGAAAVDLGGLLAPVAPPSAVPAVAQSANEPASKPKPRIIEGQQVLAILARELTKELNLQGELRLDFARPWAGIRLRDDSEWTVSINQLPTGGLSASFLVGFQVHAGDRKLGEWQAIVRAQLWESVWVATQRVDRGQPLDASQFVSQSVDVLRDKNALVSADTDLSRYEVAQALTQDRPLAWKDIVVRPLVRKGQAVEVIANDGSLSISMKGVAMESGAEGERVTIRNPDSRRDFPAFVVRPNTVQVAF